VIVLLGQKIFVNLFKLMKKFRAAAGSLYVAASTEYLTPRLCRLSFPQLYCQKFSFKLVNGFKN